MGNHLPSTLGILRPSDMDTQRLIAYNWDYS
jgi:hypothetical protein